MAFCGFLHSSSLCFQNLRKSVLHQGPNCAIPCTNKTLAFASSVSLPACPGPGCGLELLPACQPPTVTSRCFGLRYYIEAPGTSPYKGPTKVPHGHRCNQRMLQRLTAPECSASTEVSSGFSCAPSHSMLLWALYRLRSIGAGVFITVQNTPYDTLSLQNLGCSL